MRTTALRHAVVPLPRIADVELTHHLFEWTLLKIPFVAVSCIVDENVYRTGPMAAKFVTSNMMARARTGSSKTFSIRRVPSPGLF